MRMRRKKNLALRIDNCSDVLLGWLLDYNTAEHSNNIRDMLDYKEIFGSSNPVHLEIGCGKGAFICTLAEKEPGHNFIAVEKSANVIVAAMEKAAAKNLTNVRFIVGLAEYLDRILPEKSIERIYLNFSCPFPKRTYENRRLTNKRFLSVYRKIMAEKGRIMQKTDNRDFFLYSKESYTQNSFEIYSLSEDLHKSGMEGNIKTEYEENFSGKGFPIYFIEAGIK